MIRLVLVAWLALCGVANAQLSGGVGGFPGPGAASGCTPGTEATNFLARTSGLNATYTNAYCNLINGLVADGFITGNLSGAAGCGTGTKVLENLWILASDTSTNALLNICGTSFPPVPTNTPTFTAGVGYAGNGTTSYLAVAWAPSTNGVNFTQNCASMGAYIGNNRTTSNSSVIMGTAVPTSFAYIVPLETSNFKYDMNSATFPTVANGGTAGMWIATRTAASGAGATAAYKNGNTTAIQTTSSTSAARSSQVLRLLALNNNGSNSNFSADTLAAAFVGGCLTSTEQAALAARINTYMTALGVNVY